MEAKFKRDLGGRFDNKPGGGGPRGPRAVPERPGPTGKAQYSRDVTTKDRVAVARADTERSGRRDSEGGKKSAPEAESRMRRDVGRVERKPSRKRPGPQKGTPAASHEDLEERGPELLARDPEGQWSAARTRGAASRLQASTPDKLDSQKMFKPGGKVNAKGEYEGGEYTPERRRLHMAIARQFLRGLPQDVENREILFMAGGPASGKSTMLRSGVVKKPGGSVLINPDAVKGMLPEYPELLRRKDAGAAGRIHEESADLAKLITEMALARKMNITVDKTKVKPNEVKRVMAMGYRARAAVATVEIDVARRRAKARGDKSGRYVVDEILVPGHQEVAANFEKWARETGVPFVLVDTRRGLTLATADGGEITIRSRSAYARFLRRRTTQDDVLDPRSPGGGLPGSIDPDRARRDRQRRRAERRRAVS